MKRIIIFLTVGLFIIVGGSYVLKDIDANYYFESVKENTVDAYKNRGVYYTQDEIKAMLEIHKQEVIKNYKENNENELIRLEMQMEKSRAVVRSSCN